MSVLDGAMNATTLANAQRAVMNVCRTGQCISLTKPTAAKDEFGAPLGAETVLNLYSHPVRFSPYERKVTQSITWAENTDVLCYVSKMELDILQVTIEQARRYEKLQYQGKTYDIRYLELYSPFGTGHLYVVVGGTKTR